MHSFGKIPGLTAFFAGLVVLFMANSASAQYGTSGVYYEYTQLSVGGRLQAVLMPHGTDSFSRQSPLTMSIPAAFQALRDNKRTIYGNASISLNAEDLDAGRVVVYIDPTQLDLHMIVVAETVYTFTDLGVDEVLFPGVSDTPLRRHNIPFMAFEIQTPLWRALQGPDSFADGSVVFVDGSRLPAREFFSRWEEGDSDLEDALLLFLEEGETAQLGVLELLGQLPHIDALDEVIQLLETGSVPVRIAAVEYLAQTGDSEAMERLSQLVGVEENPDVREVTANALGAAGDERFQVFQYIYELEQAEEEQLAGALDRLSQLGDARAVPNLASYLSNSDRSVREAAVRGLVALESTEPVVQLFRGEEPSPFQEDVALLLSQMGDSADRILGIEYLVENSAGTIGLEYLSRLNGEPDSEEKIAALVRLLSHADVQVRVETVQAVGEAGTVDQISDLGRLFSEETDSHVLLALDKAATGLLSDSRDSDIERLANGDSLFARRAAFSALGQKAETGEIDQRIYDLLEDGLSDDEAIIRGASILGLSYLGTDEAFTLVTGLVEDANAQVRRDLALGLAHFQPGQGSEILHRYIQDSDESVVEAALSTLGEREESDAAEMVLALTSSTSSRVRAAAALAVSRLSYFELERSIVDVLMGATVDPDERVRAAAATSLGVLGSDMAVMGISPLTQDLSIEVRYQAIAALGDSGNVSASGVLTSLLEDAEPTIRIATLRAMAALGETGASEQIELLLGSESDPDVLEEIQVTLERLSQ